MALMHQNHCQHGWERFLPWPRVYLYEFEQVLQDVCPGVTMPYWDWTMPRYCPAHPDKGSIIPRSFQAYLTNESIDYLESTQPKLPTDAGKALREGMLKKPDERFTSPSKFFTEVAKLTNKKYTEGENRKNFIKALLAG